MELTGRVAVVTGASSGIGAATARALAQAGMQVVAAARRTDRLAALATAGITNQPLDVRDATQVDALATFTRERFGACHVLVNNAGINAGRRLAGPEDLPDFEDVFDVNLLGAARCMAAFADLLRASAPARVVNVASVAGKVGAGMPGYGAAKFGLVGLSEHTRTAWAADGVAVCQVNPGLIRTEGFPQRGLPRALDRLVGTPDEVARAILQVARSGRPERTVPRWYRAGILLRHCAPPLFHIIARAVEPARRVDTKALWRDADEPRGGS